MAKYEKGAIVKARVLDVDVEKERISLGIKQRAADPAATVLEGVHKGDLETCIVTGVPANGIDVTVGRGGRGGRRVSGIRSGPGTSSSRRRGTGG